MDDFDILYISQFDKQLNHLSLTSYSTPPLRLQSSWETARPAQNPNDFVLPNLQQFHQWQARRNHSKFPLHCLIYPIWVFESPLTWSDMSQPEVFWRFSVVLSTSLNTWNERITASSRQISKLCLREKPSQALADGAIWTWSWPSRLIFREEIHRKRQSVSETQRHVTGVASRQTSENQKCRLQFFKASLTKSRRQNPNWKLDYCSISKEKDPQVSICFTWLVTFSFEFSFVADGWLASQVCQVGDFKNMQLNSHVWQKLLMKKKRGEFTGPTSHFLSWAHWRRHWFDPESRENRVGKSPYITSYVG